MKIREPIGADEFVRFPGSDRSSETIPRRIEGLAPEVHDEVWFGCWVEDEFHAAERPAPHSQIYKTVQP